MTQPIPPGLPVRRFQLPAPMGSVVPPGAAPVAADTPAPVQPIDFAAIQAREAARAEQEAAKIKEQERQAAYDAAKLEALRAEHGAFGSAATSFFRGGLDALLVPGALIGAGAETVGNLYQVKALEDFGRDLGTASTGKSAMEALAYVLGGGKEGEGLAYADRSNRILAEQQEARPTLTTISRLAGTAATGLGIGAQAAGHAGAAQMLGVNVLEGAGAGAQVAYDESAPLRDVLTSAAIGGTIGAVVTGAGEGISALARRGGPDLSKVFGKPAEALQKKADELGIKSVIGRDSQAWNQIASDDALRARIAGRLRGEDIIGKADAALESLVDTKLAQFAAEETTLARQLDDALPGGVNTGLMGRIDDFVGQKLAGNTGDAVAVGKAIKRQVAPFRAKMAIHSELGALKAAVADARLAARAAEESAGSSAWVRPGTADGAGRRGGVAPGDLDDVFYRVHRKGEDLDSVLNPARRDGWVADAESFDTQPHGVSAASSLEDLERYRSHYSMNIQPGDRLVRLYGRSGGVDADQYATRVVVSGYEDIGDAKKYFDTLKKWDRAGFDAKSADYERLADRLSPRATAAPAVDVDAARARLAAAERELAAGPRVIGYKNPTLSDLAEFRRELRPLAKLGKGPTDPIGEAHRELFSIVTREVDSAADALGPTVAKTWREVGQAADDFQLLKGAIDRGLPGKAKAGLLSGAEIQTGLAGMLLGAVSAANPLTYLAYGAAGALGHKALNKIGGAVVSKLTNRFARMGTRVSLRTAGGKEMQEVLTALARTKQFAAELAEGAGANPLAREEAEELARNIATTELSKRAGKLDLDAWADARITPMQKVLYRGQLLDKVSQDVAAVAERTMALHPGLPEVLDPARLAKLTKDADGPAAIGLLRSKLSEVASGIPPTPTGEAAGVALRRAAIDLERADVAQAMAKGHSVANWLDEAADSALDEPTQEFVRNAAKAIRGEIGGENFGEAGRQYRALVDAPAALEQMANQAKLREALRGLDGHGLLPQALKEAQDQVARAYDAAAKLAGLPRPKTLGKEFEAAEHIFHAAEEALTLDGKAMHRVFETAQHAGIHEAAHPHAEANEMTVADAVDGELDNLSPIIQDAASGGAPKYYRPDKVASNLTPRLPPTLEEARDQYKQHFDQLKNFQTAMAGAQEGQHPIIAAEANEKIANLIRDIPKPPTTPLGMSSPDMLSNDDLRLANAMYEATLDPGSVIRDFAAGDLDPDKAAYAWKQYPGYQRAAQAGLIDMLSHDLTPEEREMIPENLLTQLDATFGFGGALQETSDPIFAARMSEVYRTPQEKRPPPQPNGVLKLVAAKPSFTERIANG